MNLSEPPHLKHFRIHIARLVRVLLILAFGATVVQGWAANAKNSSSSDLGSPTSPSDAPEMSTMTYGDWVILCQSVRVEGQAAAQKVCEIGQTIAAAMAATQEREPQQRTVARIALGRLKAGEPLQLTAVLPNDIQIPSTVSLTTGDVGTSSEGLTLQWVRCLPTGCIATLGLSSGEIKRFNRGQTHGVLRWQMGSGQAVELKFSLRGIEQALKAYDTMQR